MTSIRQAIRQIANDGRTTVALICTVDSVDRDKRTVDCSPINESAPLLGVNLQANQGSDFGVVLFPRKGSYVVVGFVADGSAGVVLQTDDVESVEVVVSKDSTRLTIDENGVEVKVGDSVSMKMTGDKITFNGRQDGPMPLGTKIAEEINSIKDDLSKLQQCFSNASAALFSDESGYSVGVPMGTYFGGWSPNVTHIDEGTIGNNRIEQ